MKRFVGIDIGNYAIKVLAAERDKTDNKFNTIGIGVHSSRGISKGTILDINKTANSIDQAVRLAETNSGIRGFRIDDAYISIGGIHLDSVIEEDEIFAKGTKKITQEDVYNLENSIEDKIRETQPNHEIIYKQLIEHSVDGVKIYTSPVGLTFKKELRVKYFAVVCLRSHLQRVRDAIEDSGITIRKIIPGPIAAASTILSEEQKQTGSAVVDIGAQTVSILVYDEGSPLSLKVFPVGSMNITNEIALNLKIPLKNAERIKIGVDKVDESKKIQKVIDEQLKMVFKLVNSHLENINKSGLLPGGIIINGGGAGLASIQEIASSVTRLPVKIVKGGKKINMDKANISIHNSAWSNNYGLVGLAWSDSKKNTGGIDPILDKTSRFISNIIYKIKRNIS